MTELEQQVKLLEEKYKEAEKALQHAKSMLYSARRAKNAEITGLKVGDLVQSREKCYKVAGFDPQYTGWITGFLQLKSGEYGKKEYNLYDHWKKL